MPSLSTILDHPNLVLSAKRSLQRNSKLDAETGCVEWQNKPNASGYGTMKPFGRKSFALAHRVSYTVNVGAFPDELKVLHRCDNPKCVNHAHLFLGTQVDNIADMVAKGRNKNARGERCHFSKLTAEDVIAIRKSYADGEETKTLRKRYGLTSPGLRFIIIGQSWSHIPGGMPLRSRKGVYKMPAASIELAVKMRSEGATYEKIAATIGTRLGTIHRILTSLNRA